MKKNNLLVLGFCFLSVLFLTISSSFADVPLKINYEGKLLDSSGSAVTTAKTATFKIYDALTSGTAVWTSGSYTTAPDSNGAFSIVLGSNSDTISASTVFGGATRYLEVTIAGETLAPRTALLSVPFALKASDSDTLGGTSEAFYLHTSGGTVTGLVTVEGTLKATTLVGEGSGITGVSATSIADFAVTNTKVATSAAIVDTKLATISTAGKVSGNAITSGTIGGATNITTTGIVTATAFNGDGSNLSGLDTFADNSITNTAISTIAAIAYTKLDLSDSIVDDDIDSAAAIADSKLATISTAGKVSGSSITSGTIGGSTAINTTGIVSASAISSKTAANFVISVVSNETTDGNSITIKGGSAGGAGAPGGDVLLRPGSMAGSSQYDGVVGFTDSSGTKRLSFMALSAGQSIPIFIADYGALTYFGNVDSGDTSYDFAVLRSTLGVNWLTVNGGTTGVGPTLSASGETNVDINVTPKGTGGVKVAGKLGTTTQALATLAGGATTFAVNSNVVTVTGAGGGNTIATIPGGVSGQVLVLIFVDTNVTITDTGTSASNTVNLSAAFTSAANTTLTLVYDGTSWREVARSTNG